jgi:hypothetical protein
VEHVFLEKRRCGFQTLQILLQSGEEGRKIDESVLVWFTARSNKRIPIPEPLVKEKVKEVEVENFSEANGWLEKFQKCQNISYRSGEVADVNTADVQCFQESFHQFLESMTLVQFRMLMRLVSSIELPPLELGYGWRKRNIISNRKVSKTTYFPKLPVQPITHCLAPYLIEKLR